MTHEPHSNGVALSATNSAATRHHQNPTTPQQLQAEQLQILQLSFGEHEFGLTGVELFPNTSASSAADTATGDQAERASRRIAADSRSPATTDADVELAPFDPFQFVDEKLDHGLQLAALHSDLGIFERFLQQKILQHVHDELHEAFVNVSGRLVGLEEPLQRVRGPLQSLTTKLETSMSTIVRAESSITETWQDAQVLEMKRRFHVGVAQVRLLHTACCDEVEQLETFLTAHVSTDKSTTKSGGEVQSPTMPSSSLLKALPAELITSLHQFPQRASAKELSQFVVLLQQVVASLFDLRGSFELLVVPSETVATKTNEGATEATTGSSSTSSEATREHRGLTEFVTEAAQYVSQLLAGSFLGMHHALVLCEERGGGEDYVERRKQFRAVMQLYNAVGPDEFASMYRDGIVKPFVEGILTWKACTHARTSTTATAELIGKLVDGVERTLLPACPLIRDIFSSDKNSNTTNTASPAEASSASSSSSAVSGSVKPISSIFWPAICSAVATRLVFLFTPGIPQVFHANFVAAHQIVRLMESHCPTVDELRAFRGSTDTTLWMHTWNIDVYHTLRATAGAERVREILTAPPTPSKAETVEWPSWIKDNEEFTKGHHHDGKAVNLNLTVLHPATANVMRAMLWYFSPEVYLYPLSAKLLRDAVVALRQYVVDVVDKLSAIASQPASSHNTKSTKDGNGSIAGAAAFDASKARGDLSDLVSMHHFVVGLFSHVVERVTGETCATCQPLNTVFQLASTTICMEGGIEKVQRLLTSSLEEQCYAQLQHLRTVKATYSHTKKALPTSPSWFVSSILEPLTAFRSQCTSEAVLDVSTINELVQHAIDGVSQRFRELAKETLVSARKTEESLGKLRRKREEAAAGGTAGPKGQTAAPTATNGVRITNENATDRDKMVMQLYLDAQKYAQMLTSGFGVDIESYTPVQSILRLCRRGQWIAADCVGPEPTEVEEDE